MTNLDSIKKQRHCFADKGPPSQCYVFFSSHVWMWELDHKQGWVLKNWCFLTVVLEETLERLLDSKEIKPVNPKGNKPWIFIGRTCCSWSYDTLTTWCEQLTHLKRLILGKTEGKRRRGRQRIRWLNGITVSTDRSRVTRSFLVFWGIAILFSIVAASIYSPSKMHKYSLSFNSSSTFVISYLFDDSHSSKYEVISL